MPAPTRARLFAITAIATLGGTSLSGCAPTPTGAFADTTFDIAEVADVTYGSAIDEHGQPQSLELDLYRPVDAEGPRPAIVFIHSGAFTGGSRTEMTGWAQQFARRGYVTVTIEYRLREGEWIWFNSPSAVALSAVTDARHDAQASVRWLRDHAVEYGIDPGRIGAVGYSAGAITAIGVGQHPGDPGDSGTPGPSSKICVAVSVSGMSVEGPIEADDAPVLMFHGSEDIIIPTAYARETASQAMKVSQLASYVEYPQIGHTVPHQRTPELTPVMVQTLREKLVEQPACV